MGVPACHHLTHSRTHAQERQELISASASDCVCGCPCSCKLTERSSMTESPPQLIVSGGTIIDGVSSSPLDGYAVWIKGNRIRAVCPSQDLPRDIRCPRIDAQGKFIIPGLMNANVHLFSAITLERLARHADNFEALILEAAQLALKSGLTTVFDTWGPRRHLIRV